MNKTVDSIKIYKLTELGNSSYEAVVDVELRNALDFGAAPLVINTGRITLDESSKLLKNYISILKNYTLKSSSTWAVKLNAIKIEFEKVLISFDQKLDVVLQANETNKQNNSLSSSVEIDSDAKNNFQTKAINSEKTWFDDIVLERSN